MKLACSADTLQMMIDACVPILEPARKPMGLLAFARTLRVKSTDPRTGADIWVPFEPADHPNQLEVLRAFAEHPGELVVLGPVQDGKTYATIVVIMLYCIIELRQSVGLMLPEEEAAHQLWLTKVVPVINESGYGWILPTEGRGSKTGASRFMVMKTGATVHLIGAGAKNESAQSSFTVRVMLVDERSKIRPRWVMLAQGRTKSYDLAGRFATTSTIGDDFTDQTVQAYGDSTGHRCWYQCPHCIASGHPSGGWQLFDWDIPEPDGIPVPFSRFLFDSTNDDTARASVRLRCAHVETHLITEEERRLALRTYRSVAAGQSVNPAGVVTGDAVINDRKGIRWHALESPMKSMGQLALDLNKALIQRNKYNNHEPLRQFYRDQRVEGYTSDAMGKPGTITNGNLYEISKHSLILKRIVPHWAQYLTIAVDVQKRECYFEVMAWGSDQRWAIIDYGYESMVPSGHIRETYEPTDADLMRILYLIDDKANAGWQVAGRSLDAPRMQPVMRGVDVGYHQTKVLNWIATRQNWTPIKGMGQRDEKGKIITVEGDHRDVSPQLVEVLRITRPEHWDRDCLWPIGDIIRHRVHSGLLMQPTGGSGQIPQGLKLADQLLLHLAAVIWTVEDDKTGAKGQGYWREKVHPRWDLLDCAIYNWALGMWYHYELLAASAKREAAERLSPEERTFRPVASRSTIQRRSSVLDRRRLS